MFGRVMLAAAYYNEIDPYAAQWLRNLIAAGHIARGVVDERSIEDVRPEDLQGFEQCHFFAGLGGWPRALRLAGWPDDRPVWTGSPPCQPFSTAGKGRGKADARHLAPAWLDLVSQCRPDTVFGEQVAAAIGRGWLDDLQDCLEAENYACGAVVLPACGVGAPHLRQRLWFVAELLAKPDGNGSYKTEGDEAEPGRDWSSNGVPLGGGSELRQPDGPGPVNGHWRNADWLECRDGKWRPARPGTHPLAHGVPGRVGRLRAYGNAIVPQVAAEVIAALMEHQTIETGGRYG